MSEAQWLWVSCLTIGILSGCDGEFSARRDTVAHDSTPHDSVNPPETSPVDASQLEVDTGRDAVQEEVDASQDSALADVEVGDSASTDIVVPSDVTPSACPRDPGSLIGDGGFSQGLGCFQPELHVPDSARFVVDTEVWQLASPSVRVEVFTPVVYYQVQLAQHPIRLEGGREYTIRFWARASLPGQANVQIGQAYAPWSGLGLWQDFALEPAWKEYVFHFTATMEESNAKFGLSLGQVARTVWVDDLSITPRERGVRHCEADADCTVEEPECMSARCMVGICTADVRTDTCQGISCGLNSCGVWCGNCPPGHACEAGACRAVTGDCRGQVDGSTCDDGDPCTSEDRCVGGGCSGESIQGCVQVTLRPTGTSEILWHPTAFPDGFAIEAPPGAVAQPTTIGVAPLAEVDIEGEATLTQPLRLEPSGLVLALPISFELPLRTSASQNVLTDTALGVIRDGPDDAWHVLRDEPLFDEVGASFTISVDHFSDVGILGMPLTAPIGRCGDTSLPTLLLVHGLFGAPETFGPIASAGNANPLLAGDVKPCIYAVNYSTGFPIQLNAERLSKVIRNLFDRHGGRPVLVASHSMGGLVARKALVGGFQIEPNTSSRVWGLVTLGTPHFGCDPVIATSLTVLCALPQYFLYCRALGNALNSVPQMFPWSTFLSDLNAQPLPDLLKPSPDYYVRCGGRDAIVPVDNCMLYQNLESGLLAPSNSNERVEPEYEHTGENDGIAHVNSVSHPACGTILHALTNGRCDACGGTCTQLECQANADCGLCRRCEAGGCVPAPDPACNGTCQQGVCVPPCDNECVVHQTGCASATRRWTCGQSDGDICLDRVETSCPPNTACSNGACVTDCAAVCAGRCGSVSGCACGGCGANATCNESTQACVGCPNNFCSVAGLSSGLHCDGRDRVSCGTSGGCRVETSRSTCADLCSGGACVAPACGGTDQPCCNGTCNAGNFCSQGTCRGIPGGLRVVRYRQRCSNQHWSSTSSCYPGVNPTSGCGNCGLVVNAGCTTGTCWVPESSKFWTFNRRPDFGTFKALYHCFVDGANRYQSSPCAQPGEPHELGWVSASAIPAPVGFNLPLYICNWSPPGGVAEQFLSISQAECQGAGGSLVGGGVWGYVAPD